MIITAAIKNSLQQNTVSVATNNKEKTLSIPSKADGQGSLVNGGELLCLALATCFCNDVYREAAKRNMNIASVDVTVSGAFGNEGEPASNITYNVTIQAPHHSPEEIAKLIQHVDSVAEVHNTLRNGVSVSLKM